MLGVERHPYALMVGMQTSLATMEITMEGL